MTSICFVCNLPIMSHQVGLVWQGGNGWDEMVREQLEESTIRQRLGGRRDSAAQISAASPPSTSPPPSQRRRRSSLAQLTDILREWSGGGSKRQKAPLNRRETLADLARSLPWGRNTDNSTHNNQSHLAQRKRRESSADSGIKSMRSRRESHTSDFNKMWPRKESPGDRDRDKENTDTGASTDGTRNGSRRGSGESFRSGRRDSTINRAITPPPPKVVGATKKRRDSLTVVELPNFRQEQRPSTSSTASDSGPYFVNSQDTGCQALPPPTIVTSSVTPPATSPTAPPSGRRDSTTQCGRVNRRDSRVSPERPRLQRLQRQATAFDESCPPLGSRRESQPALSPTGPDGDEGERRARRDSLSPDSASRGRRDSRQHLSPDRSHDRDGSPRRRSKVRRQSSSDARNPRSPESSSCCSSRDPSPCARAPPPLPITECAPRPAIRRQSTTEEILISRGFRRQSTTEEMIRCRNFRRQSSQSDDTCRYRGRRDSCAQITDGTIGTMTVETTSTFFDSSTQTDPLLGSGSEDEEDDEPAHHIRGSGLGLGALVGLGGNGPDSLGNLGPSDMSVQSTNSDSKMTQDDSDQGSIDGDPDCRGDSQAENKSPDDGANGSKRRGPRTTIKAKQLDVLKNAFSQTPKPTRHIREQLAKETGLPMRVIQVWFQNKRSKERRMKQLTSMGRGPFFGGARKMRGFPMNLSPGGLDEAGFPYFGHEGKFEFGYGGPPFHSHGDAPFFPGHGPIGPLPFNGSVGPIDHPNSMPMVNEFGGMTPESNFMNQNASNQGGAGGGVNGPGNGVNGPDHNLINGQRNGSPSEFMGSGNFSEPQNMQNEGLVW